MRRHLFYLVLAIYYHTVKWFQVLLFNTNYSIQYYSFICTQVHSFKYFYLAITIQFNIYHLSAHLQMVKHFYLNQR